MNEGGVTLTDCVFKDNVATDSMKLILSIGGDLSLNAVDFSDNTVPEGAMIFAVNGTGVTMIDNCFSGNVVTGLIYIEKESGAALLEASGNYESGNSIFFECAGFIFDESLTCSPFTGTSCRGDSMGDDMVSITGSPTASPSGSPTTSPSAGPNASPSAAPQVATTTTGSPTASPSAGPNTSPSAAPQVATTTTGAPVTATVTDVPVASPSGSPTASPSAGPNTSPSAAPQVATTTTGAPVTATITDAPVASPTVSAGFQARMWKVSASGTTLFGAMFVMMCF